MNSTDSTNWVEYDLSELIAVIESGQRPYGGATEESGEIPSLGGENIRQGGGLELSAIKKVPTDFYRAMTKGVLQNQDVLINKDGANTGKAGIYNGQFPVATINEHLFLLRGKPERLAQRFLYRVLISEGGQRTVRARISGSAQPGLKSDFIRNFPVRFPKSTAEQARIAAVLDTVDEAIAKTAAVIEKLKQVRAGLLHDLLTRGLDEHGQLRDPIAHPEQFQDSPLGRIPRAWEVELLGARLQQNAGFVQTGPFGSQLHASEYTREGVPVIMPQDINAGSVVDENIARISIQKADHLRRHHVEDGDLIFARRGDLGRCATVTNQEVHWLCGTGCLLMRFEQRTLFPKWLSLAYRHDIGQRQIAARAVGTTMVNLNTQLLAHLSFAFPEKREQEAIVQHVEGAEKAIEAEMLQLSKLALLKSGLMTDLLTGRIRVPEGIRVG